MTVAARHALIVGAYGGVATIAMPDEQRRVGLRDRVLRAGLFELETPEQFDGPDPRD
jgi:hypothetical protein